MTFKLVVIVLAVAIAFSPSAPWWIERGYSQGVYLRVQRLLTPLSNRVPFAVLDLFAAFVILSLAMLCLKAAASGRGRRLHALGRLALRSSAIASLLYIVFMVMWGFNYRRLPVGHKLDFEEARVSSKQLARLAETAVTQLNLLYVTLTPDSWPAPYAFSDELVSGFHKVQGDLDMPLLAVPGRPKRSLLNLYLARSAVDGMTDPFFLEIILNPRVLPLERPFVTAHEWAHLAGYADESEANFIGWLTCMRASGPERYSAWIFLYPFLLRHLSEDNRQSVNRRLDAGPRQDLEAIASRLRETSPFLRRASSRVYDRFLKVNRVEAGIASYENIVRLILGTRFEPGWVPALRRSNHK